MGFRKRALVKFFAPSPESVALVPVRAILGDDDEPSSIGVKGKRAREKSPWEAPTSGGISPQLKGGRPVFVAP